MALRLNADRWRMQVLRDGSADTLELRGRPLAVARLAAGVWTAGWLAIAGSLVSHAIRYGWSVRAVASLTIWILLGGVAVIALAWTAAGHPERIRVNAQELSVSRGLGPFGRTFHFNGGALIRRAL